MGRAEREEGPGVRGSVRVLCCKCGCQLPTRAGGIKCAQVLLLLPPRVFCAAAAGDGAPPARARGARASERAKEGAPPAEPRCAALST